MDKQNKTERLSISYGSKLCPRFQLNSGLLSFISLKKFSIVQASLGWDFGYLLPKVSKLIYIMGWNESTDLQSPKNWRKIGNCRKSHVPWESTKCKSLNDQCDSTLSTTMWIISSSYIPKKKNYINIAMVWMFVPSKFPCWNPNWQRRGRWGW